MDDSFFSRPLSPPKPPRQQQPQKAYSSLHYNSPSKENTRNGDLFNLSSADRVIKSLLDTVQTQSHQIKQLQLQQQSLAGQSLVKSSVDELSRQIAVLSEKIEVIEAEISTDPNSNPNNSNKIGLMTLANRRALASISAILSKKATTKAMEQTITTINANIIERCDSIKKFAASSREQANLSQQLISVKALINNIKQDLGEKVDRVDIEGVMSDAEYVKSHASWLYESEKKMVEMVKRVEDHKSSQTRMDDNIDSLNNHVAVLQEEMLHRVSAGDFISLKAAVSTLEKSTKTKAGQTQVDEVVKMLVAHGRQFDEVGEVFEMNAEKEAAKFRNVHKLMEEGQREVMKQVNQCVKRDNFARIVAGIRQEVAAKAWSTTLSDVSKTLSQLEIEHGKTRVTADVCRRFVEWHTKRGEVYEQNLNAVDGHLRNLAVQAHTSLRK